MSVMSDRGTPHGYRQMRGFGSQTFSLINAANEMVWVKFHMVFGPEIKNFMAHDAAEMKSQDSDFAQRDLLTSIDKGDFPKRHMKIQVMTEQEARGRKENPFDVTKVWRHAEFPLINVGTVELCENPKNYFVDIEQAAFAPAHVVDGIWFSPDKMLQGRIFGYPDAQRYRLGANYEQIPVNRCPYAANLSAGRVYAGRWKRRTTPQLLSQQFQ